MKGMLAPVYEEVVIGQADVRQIYKVSKIGTIAGCMVTDGKMKRDCKVRLFVKVLLSIQENLDHYVVSTMMLRKL